MLITGGQGIRAYLDKIGEPGSSNRLKEIARLDLGDRSEAARRVLVKRSLRVKPTTDSEF